MTQNLAEVKWQAAQGVKAAQITLAKYYKEQGDNKQAQFWESKAAGSPKFSPDSM